MQDLKLHGSLIKKLSISVAELSVILVGLLIIGISDSEYIVFRNEVVFAYSNSFCLEEMSSIFYATAEQTTAEQTTAEQTTAEQTTAEQTNRRIEQHLQTK